MPVEKRFVEITGEQEKTFSFGFKRTSMIPAAEQRPACRRQSFGQKTRDWHCGLPPFRCSRRSGQPPCFFFRNGPVPCRLLASTVRISRRSRSSLSLRIEQVPTLDRGQGSRIGQFLALYLHLHPDDKSTRDRAVSVAEQQCRVRGLLARPGDRDKRVTAGIPITSAWEILLEAKALHAGMRPMRRYRSSASRPQSSTGGFYWQENNGGVVRHLTH